MAVQGLGSMNFWGFSPAVDLLEHIPAGCGDDVKILVVGGGDVRHILQTLSRCRRHKKKVTNDLLTLTKGPLYHC